MEENTQKSQGRDTKSGNTNRRITRNGKQKAIKEKVVGYPASATFSLSSMTRQTNGVHRNNKMGEKKNKETNQPNKQVNKQKIGTECKNRKESETPKEKGMEGGKKEGRKKERGERGGRERGKGK